MLLKELTTAKLYGAEFVLFNAVRQFGCYSNLSTAFYTKRHENVLQFFNLLANSFKYYSDAIKRRPYYYGSFMIYSLKSSKKSFSIFGNYWRTAYQQESQFILGTFQLPVKNYWAASKNKNSRCKNNLLCNSCVN